MSFAAGETKDMTFTFADPIPLDATDLILGSDQVALQIHESVGHAVELDRILGWEAAFAGTSWLDIGQLGTLRFGSDLMTITGLSMAAHAHAVNDRAEADKVLRMLPLKYPEAPPLPVKRRMRMNERG